MIVTKLRTPGNANGFRGEETIESLAQAELRRSAYPAVRRASCAMREGVLTLTGRVHSYYEKQVAQSVVWRCVEGIAVLDNQLEVLAPESMSNV